MTCNWGWEGGAGSQAGGKVHSEGHAVCRSCTGGESPAKVVLREEVDFLVVGILGGTFWYQMCQCSDRAYFRRSHNTRPMPSFAAWTPPINADNGAARPVTGDGAH